MTQEASPAGSETLSETSCLHGDRASELKRKDRASRAVLAVLAAMGESAPTEIKDLAYLTEVIGIAMQRVAADRERFLTERQRGLLIDVVALNRATLERPDEWIADVAVHGYWGYLQETDQGLIEKVGQECGLHDLQVGTAWGLNRAGAEERAVYEEALNAMTSPRAIEILERLGEGSFLPEYRDSVASTIHAPKG